MGSSCFARNREGRVEDEAGNRSRQAPHVIFALHRDDAALPSSSCNVPMAVRAEPRSHGEKHKSNCGISTSCHRACGVATCVVTMPATRRTSGTFSRTKSSTFFQLLLFFRQPPNCRNCKSPRTSANLRGTSLLFLSAQFRVLPRSLAFPAVALSVKSSQDRSALWLSADLLLNRRRCSPIGLGRARIQVQGLLI